MASHPSAPPAADPSNALRQRDLVDLVKRERLAAADRSNTQWQRDLAVSHGKLASIYERQSLVADFAVQELTKAKEIMAALVAFAPNNATWKNDLAWYERQIARLQGQVRAQ